MTNGLVKAKELLHSGGYTCVLCKNDDLYTSLQRGVKPLVTWLESKNDFGGFCAADKVVGRATAYLYLLLGVSAVYAKVISRPALEVLCENNIAVEYDSLVDNIINRQGDGICPFEAAVLDITDATLAYKAIRGKMQQMNITV